MCIQLYSLPLLVCKELCIHIRQGKHHAPSIAFTTLNLVHFANSRLNSFLQDYTDLSANECEQVQSCSAKGYRCLHHGTK